MRFQLKAHSQRVIALVISTLVRDWFKWFTICQTSKTKWRRISNRTKIRDHKRNFPMWTALITVRILSWTLITFLCLYDIKSSIFRNEMKQFFKISKCRVGLQHNNLVYFKRIRQIWQLCQILLKGVLFHQIPKPELKMFLRKI